MTDKAKRRRPLRCDCPSSAPPYPDCCIERERARTLPQRREVAHRLQEEALARAIAEASQPLPIGKPASTPARAEPAQAKPALWSASSVGAEREEPGPLEGGTPAPLVGHIPPYPPVARGQGAPTQILDSSSPIPHSLTVGDENSGDLDFHPTSTDTYQTRAEWANSDKNKRILEEANQLRHERRQKSVKKAQAYAAEHSIEALKVLVGLMRSGQTEKIQKEAACELLDRGIGKAQLASFLDEQSGDDSDVSDDELDRLLSGDA